MLFKQFYLGCLAHASYMIGSEGKACVVDPQRDVDQYIEWAFENRLKIEYIIETHIHADFVGGHKELAERTDALILFGRAANLALPYKGVSDGEVIDLGKVRLTILETPGHTPESICILVSDLEKSNKPQMVLTGDTLFIGDVGRPDLVGAKGRTSEEMAGLLFDSLHSKLLTLEDDVLVYPAHGAGSLCGKNLSSERFSTIGQQRRFNYALKVMTRAEFIAMMCMDLPEIPAYFPVAVEANQRGARPLNELPAPQALSARAVHDLMQKDHVVVDVRPGALFGAAHLPGSLNIGLGGQFASWAGALIPFGKPIILVVESQENVDEAMTRLARAGHESVHGYLDGGIDAWRAAGFPVQVIAHISVDELNEKLAAGNDLQLIDVRRVTEYNGAHAPSASNIPLCELEKNLEKIDSERPTAVICASGYRSSIATCIMKKIRPDMQVCNVMGGTNAWKAAGFEVEGNEKAPSCASA